MDVLCQTPPRAAEFEEQYIMYISESVQAHSAGSIASRLARPSSFICYLGPRCSMSLRDERQMPFVPGQNGCNVMNLTVTVIR